MPEGSAGLLALVPEEFVRIDGLPFEDGPSDWRVNDRLSAILSGSDDRTGLIFQRADASEEWFSAVLDGTDVQAVFRFESPDAAPRMVGTPDLGVVDTAETAGDLDG